MVMPSIPYDASRRSLLHAGDADDFFQFGARQTDAALCAEMSRLAYVTQATRLASYLERADFTLVQTTGGHHLGLQAFIAANPVSNTTVVAFRGSEAQDPSDIFDDATFALTDWCNADGHLLGKVHRGFAEQARRDNAFRSIKSHLDTLPPGTRLLLTGHSLGAALATLMASWVPRAALYTLGSPRVGDAAFARSLKNTISVRIVNCCDLVTRVPPASPFDYTHIGTLVYLDRRGVEIEAPSEDFIRNDRAAAAAHYLVHHAFLRGTVFSRELADHTPVNYVSGIMGIRAPE